MNLNSDKTLHKAIFECVFFALAVLLMCCPLLADPAESVEPLEASTSPSVTVSGGASVRGDLLLVIGAIGTDDYGREFRSWGDKWVQAAHSGGMRVVSLGMQEPDSTLDQFRASLAALDQTTDLPLWVVFIGHGTFDGRTTKFNLPGEDLEPEELHRILSKITRPTAIIHCSSASAGFLPAFSGPKRVVITATSTGNEVNFSRFGGFLADSIAHPEADLDKDDQVSLLEAFLRASRLTEEFYEANGRIATEHSILDDNGDGRPVPASGFDGVRPARRSDPANRLPDGIMAHQWTLNPTAADAHLTPEVLARRNELELQVSALRNRKAEMSEDDYYAALEPLFVELARLTLSGTAPPDVAPSSRPPD